jgi:tRNA (guanine-N7-)-methyltransferase
MNMNSQSNPPVPPIAGLAADPPPRLAEADAADFVKTSTSPSGTSHIRSFVHRRAHITPGQKEALERLLPLWSLPYRNAQLDFNKVFGRQAPTVLEIGFGMGETTQKIAQARPGDNFLGVEVFNAGVGALLKRIDESGPDNIRIIQHDAVEVARDMIAPDSLAGVHIYFPDPWPKKRHHKRRLIQPAFIALLTSRIKPGGYIHCATDWENYAEQMLEVLSGEPSLANTADGYAPRPDFRPQTKFETRGLRLGHGVWDLIFKRK